MGLIETVAALLLTLSSGLILRAVWIADQDEPEVLTPSARSRSRAGRSRPRPKDDEPDYRRAA